MLYLIERDKRFELLLTGKEDFVDIDFLLIRKMKQGDDDAFDTFVRKYYDDILRYCGYHCSDLISKVGLSKASNKKMKKLSGGMKRRAGIAQAVLNDPKILILDEPTAGLDPNERIRFRNLISELSEDRLVLLSTHIVSDVEYIANEIWLMNDGQLLQQGTADELIRSMDENVWKCYADKSDVPALMKQYKISNIKSEPHGVELRIISKEKPFPDAVMEEANLEDVFLYYFGEKAGVDDAVI